MKKLAFSLLLALLVPCISLADHQPEVDAILAGKIPIYDGACSVNAEGDLSFIEPAGLVACRVGVDLATPDILYVLFGEGNLSTRITTFNKVTGEMLIVWKIGETPKPTEVPRPKGQTDT